MINKIKCWLGFHDYYNVVDEELTKYWSMYCPKGVEATPCTYSKCKRCGATIGNTRTVEFKSKRSAE